MQPLLKIQNVPIQISYTSKRASLQMKTKQPGYDATRIRGKSEIRTEPARINMDSSEMRASIGLKTSPRLTKEFAEAGKSAALEAVTTYARNGRKFVDALQNGNKSPIPEIARQKVLTSYETIMNFLPTTGPEMWVEGGTISFDYTPDQLEFNWNVETRPEVEFEPGGIEFQVSQYHQVVIEYLGRPNYVPASADPEHIPAE